MRYFFNTADGSRNRDTYGKEFAGLAEAKHHAVVYAGQSMALDASILEDGLDFRVEVTDGGGRLVFTVTTSATMAEADNPGESPAG